MQREDCPLHKPAKVKYSDETKAAALAALLAGQSVSAVAREYKLPKGTVSNWKNHPSQDGVRPDRTQKREAIGALLLEYLHTNLETLKQQSVFFRDTAWLAKQSAADAAVLHGVMTDKSIRLLEALGGTGDGAIQQPA